MMTDNDLIFQVWMLGIQTQQVKCTQPCITEVDPIVSCCPKFTYQMIRPLLKGRRHSVIPCRGLETKQLVVEIKVCAFNWISGFSVILVDDKISFSDVMLRQHSFFVIQNQKMKLIFFSFLIL